MYEALLLPNKELLEMQREKRDSKALQLLNMMLGSCLALWGRDAGLPRDAAPSQNAEDILNGKVVKQGLKDISKPYPTWAVRSKTAIWF